MAFWIARLVFSFILALTLGRKRQIGELLTFALSFCLTPIFAIFIVLFSRKASKPNPTENIINQVLGIILMILGGLTALGGLISLVATPKDDYFSEKHSQPDPTILIPCIGILIWGYYVFMVGRGKNLSEETSHINSTSNDNEEYYNEDDILTDKVKDNTVTNTNIYFTNIKNKLFYLSILLILAISFFLFKDKLFKKYDAVGTLSCGYSHVIKGGKSGFIDSLSNEITPIIYDRAGDFFSGRAMVGLNGSEGFIDTKGNIIVPIIYDFVCPVFRNGITSVVKDSKYGFVDEQGTEFIPCIYDAVETLGAFENGFAKVKKNNTYLFIDKKGKEYASLPQRKW